MSVTARIPSEVLPRLVRFLTLKGVNVTKTRRAFDEIELLLEDPAQEEDAALLVDLYLREWRLRRVEEYDPSRLRLLTPDRLAAYIDENVTDLESAKEFLKKLGGVVLFLIQKLSGDI